MHNKRERRKELQGCVETGAEILISYKWDQFAEIVVAVAVAVECRAKGQLSSKCLFGIFLKTNKKINFTSMVPQVEMFLVVFWVKLKTSERHFKINWPLQLFD